MGCSCTYFSLGMSRVVLDSLCPDGNALRNVAMTLPDQRLQQVRDETARMRFTSRAGGPMKNFTAGTPRKRGLGILARQCSTLSRSVAHTIMAAPPMRVEICANGIKPMRLEAERMATSPVPPSPLWHAVTVLALVSSGFFVGKWLGMYPVESGIVTAQIAK